MNTGINPTTGFVSQAGTFKVAPEFSKTGTQNTTYHYDSVAVDYSPVDKGDKNSYTIFGVPYKHASDFSEKALLVNETSGLPVIAGIGMKTSMFLAGMGAAGAVGMTAVSIHGLVKAKDPVEKLDHATNLGWGVQTGTKLAAAANLVGTGLSAAADVVGGVGGALSTGVGIHKYITGVKNNDEKKRIMGALDIGIGCSWMVASLTPAATVGTVVFLILGATKIGMSSKDQIKGLMNKFLKQNDPKSEHLLHNTTQPVKTKPAGFNVAVSHKF
ncbi:MAG: hypothetical protein LWY06_18195 [Firmicutes bacterium]|nr:hypothetical protein [Bacillota bacterium]